MSRKRQTGFSLLELLVAMMIIAVIGTLGFKSYMKYMASAHYLKAQDTVKTVSEGLDQYYLKHGKYPELGSWDAMVDANSVLVKENMLPVNTPSKDPFDNPYEGSSGKGTYLLKCGGDPANQEERGLFTREPGKITGGEPSSHGGAAGAAAGDKAPAGGATK